MMNKTLTACTIFSIGLSLSAFAQEAPSTTEKVASPAEGVVPPKTDEGHPVKMINKKADEAFKLVQVKANSFKNLNAAVAIYEAIENDPDLQPKRKVKALNDLSRAYLRLGDKGTKKAARIAHYKKGMAAADRALKVDPKNADALFWKTANMALVGKTNGVMKSLFMVDDLKKNLQEVLKRNPNHSYARNTLADVFHAVPGIAGGSDKKAKKLYLETIKRDPRFSPVYVDLGQFYLDEGEDELAKSTWEKCVKMSNSSIKNDWRKFDKKECAAHLAQLNK